MSSFLGGWVTHGGLAVVFVLMIAESCGIPFPSEVIMPFAGALAASGQLSLGPVIAVGAAGDIVGSLLAYSLARRFGAPLLLGPGRHVGISAKHLELAQRWFARYGTAAIPVGRLLPVIRTYISFPAGLAKVRLPLFAVLTSIGAIPWCALLAWAGFELDTSYTKVSGPISKVAIVFAVVLLLVIVWWFVRGRRPHDRSKT